jgi:hypothetical protein
MRSVRSISQTRDNSREVPELDGRLHPATLPHEGKAYCSI